MKRAAKVWRTAWKVALAGLATFLLLEAVLTLFPDVFFPQRFYVYDPDMGFRVKPHGRYGTVQANEFGFNDRDYPHQPASGVYRILVLGDSFNWAGGPLGNYTNQLEERFGELLGPGRVEVIAAGYPMTHTVEQLELLKKFGLQYHPDLVVLGFFAGNDFLDAHPQRRRIGFGGTFVDYNTEKDWFFEVLGHPVVLQSRLFAFLDEKWVLWRTQRRVEQERRSAEQARSGEARSNRQAQSDGQVPSADRESSQAPLHSALQEREEHSIINKKPQASGPPEVRRVEKAEATQQQPELGAARSETRSEGRANHQERDGGENQPPPIMTRGEYVDLTRAWAEFARLEEASKFDSHVEYIFSALQEMKSLLDERGIPLLVAALPAEWQVDESLRREMLDKFGLSDSQFHWTRAQDLLSEFCQRRNIEFHDLTPAFGDSVGQGAVLYQPNDTHWNDQGNRLAARVLLEILQPRAVAYVSDQKVQSDRPQPPDR
ncbi:MAG TPA: SGNH/GDSL hydrolase family protein [Acidobacteriota bacterium]|nr:SGNH/GDSL hydrolase family protein [Acidobacteriota bacterium]